jgi:chromosome partitioning protein
MDHLVVTVGGQKGGTGKSTVAQGIAVEAAKAGQLVLLADLDAKQATSSEWAKRRSIAQIRPRIEARLTNARQVWELARLCNLLVIDTPGQADLSTLELAQRSDLLVLTTGTNLIELEPTVLLTRELLVKGIPRERIAVALTKVIDADREREARNYLKSAKLEALPSVLRWNKTTHDVATDGRAVTEAPNREVVKEARGFFEAVGEALERAVRAERKDRKAIAIAQAMRQGGRGRERT